MMKFWANSITVKYLVPNQWTAEIIFLGNVDMPANGIIKTNISLPLADALDIMVSAARHIGIEWVEKSLRMYRDGVDGTFPPPDGWRELLKAEAERIGFDCHYVVWSFDEQTELLPAEKREDWIGE